MTRIGNTDLDVFPLALGGNVFGWTADEPTSFAILDAYTAGGGNFIDTADAYSAWVPGNTGGESESIIGRWLSQRGRRHDLVLATKGSSHPQFKGLRNIRAAAEASLRRLGTDCIDLYYVHEDDPRIPLEEFLVALDRLVHEGKIRHIAASIISAERLADALAFSTREGLAKFVVLQPHYNLVERTAYESSLLDVVASHGLSSVPFFGLAKGFLTGKYRPGVAIDSPRAPAAGRYLATERGLRVLAALDEVANAHEAEISTVALAWLAAQPTVVAPIASARNVAQLPALLALADLKLTDAEIAKLTTASA
ncbi:aldo/keto reductase [Pendulispora brunnea]|uniref:Aldo/keto reductase n=1 Tax=Pendulispora brunnea TaxID=2905690 RepID=A0ABZ2KV50_9BACT